MFLFLLNMVRSSTDLLLFSWTINFTRWVVHFFVTCASLFLLNSIWTMPSKFSMSIFFAIPSIIFLRRLPLFGSIVVFGWFPILRWNSLINVHLFCFLDNLTLTFRYIMLNLFLQHDSLMYELLRLSLRIHFLFFMCYEDY